jgi:hypothetical protein
MLATWMRLVAGKVSVTPLFDLSLVIPDTSCGSNEELSHDAPPLEAGGIASQSVFAGPYCFTAMTTLPFARPVST